MPEPLTSSLSTSGNPAAGTPIAACYEQGHIHRPGYFDKLEN